MAVDMLCVWTITALLVALTNAVLNVNSIQYGCEMLLLLRPSVNITPPSPILKGLDFLREVWANCDDLQIN